MSDRRLVRVSWREVEDICRALAARLDGSQFDAILAVARGGLVPAALLAQELCIRNVMVAAVAGYEGDRRGQMAFLRFPAGGEVRSKSILVADDIWDSGRTLHHVRSRLVRAGADVTVAVLHYKPSMSEYPAESPDLWCRETDSWILYPWERDT